MVIGDKLPWKYIFRLHAPWLLATFLVAAAAWMATRIFQLELPFTPVPFQIAGVALAIFLGFRNNSAYDRWWEGRKLWGGIVNHSRALARQVLTLPVAPEADRPALLAAQRRIIYRQIAWLYAVKQQLRAADPLEELKGLLPADELEGLKAQKNVAAWLIHTNGVEVAGLAAKGWLSDYRLEILDRSLTELISLQGGCERIKSTPIPTAYRIFTYRFTRVFISVLPLGLVEHLSPSNVPVLIGLSLAFLVLETLGRILEDPFSTGPNGLALGAIARNIEINLRQQLGETELPEPAKPTLFNGIPILL
ncbi:MAG: bestrophin family ion channel [Myxococcota bacterium]